MTSRPIIDEETLNAYLIPMSPIDTGVASRLAVFPDIKAVLFDIYGTLFISGSGDVGVSKERSRKLSVLDDLMTKFSVKEPADHILERFYLEINKTHEQLKKNGIEVPEVNIDLIWMDVLGFSDIDRARAFAVEFELINNPVYPMPNMAEVLGKLGKKDIALGIISNAQFFTPLLFKWLLGKTPIELGFDPDLTIYSYQHDTAKPSRFLFSLAASKLSERGMPAGSVLYIGNDMLNDIYAAKLAGFKTALFAGDKRSLRLRESDHRCKDISPDLIVTDLTQLINLFS